MQTGEIEAFEITQGQGNIGTAHVASTYFNAKQAFSEIDLCDGSEPRDDTEPERQDDIGSVAVVTTQNSRNKRRRKRDEPSKEEIEEEKTEKESREGDCYLVLCKDESLSSISAHVNDLVLTFRGIGNGFPIEGTDDATTTTTTTEGHVKLNFGKEHVRKILGEGFSFSPEKYVRNAGTETRDEGDDGSHLELPVTYERFVRSKLEKIVRIATLDENLTFEAHRPLDCAKCAKKTAPCKSCNRRHITENLLWLEFFVLVVKHQLPGVLSKRRTHPMVVTENGSNDAHDIYVVSGKNKRRGKGNAGDDDSRAPKAIEKSDGEREREDYASEGELENASEGSSDTEENDSEEYGVVSAVPIDKTARRNEKARAQERRIRNDAAQTNSPRGCSQQ
jgi:hypothetical protein